MLAGGCQHVVEACAEMTKGLSFRRYRRFGRFEVEELG